jgi:hypothetical protein
VIISGSMNLSGSFLSDPPIAALFFENDGSMRLLVMNSNEQPKEEIDNILLISDFFQYALSKDEWMKEFVNLAITEDSSVINEKNKPVLKLIHGGLSNMTGSNINNFLN